MKLMAENSAHQERLIAGLLRYGTWIASILIAAGMLMTAFTPLPTSVHLAFNGYAVVKAGVAVFIFLPIVRVALMLVLFLREQDYLYMLIAILVLVNIAAGIAFER